MTRPIRVYYGADCSRMYRGRQRCITEALAEFGPICFLSQASPRPTVLEWRRRHLERISSNLAAVRSTFGCVRHVLAARRRVAG